MNLNSSFLQCDSRENIIYECDLEIDIKNARIRLSEENIRKLQHRMQLQSAPIMHTRNEKNQVRALSFSTFR